MKQEYRNKLDKMRWFFNNYKTIPDVELHEIGMNSFVYPMEELSLTKDEEVLACLLDFFEEQFDFNSEGVLESLESFIQCNFTSDQIIAAFYRKFDLLMKKCPARCAGIAMRFFDDDNGEDFVKFRKFFNSIKPKYGKDLIDLFKSWFEYGWSKKRQGYVHLLENDMKKW